jgi:hypothetical protein
MITPLPPDRRRARRLAGMGACLLAPALGIGVGCSVANSNQTFQVPGTPDTCSGQVYFEVPASACFTFGCTSGGKAYALCESDQYIACSCEPPCAVFKPGPGSPVPDAAPIECDASPEGDDGGGDGGAPDAPADVMSVDVHDAHPGDARGDARDGSTAGDAHEG